MLLRFVLVGLAISGAWQIVYLMILWNINLKAFNANVEKAWRMIGIHTGLTSAEIEEMLRHAYQRELFCAIDKQDDMLCFRDRAAWLKGFGNTYYLKPHAREGHYTLYVSGSFRKRQIDIRRMRSTMLLLGNVPA